MSAAAVTAVRRGLRPVLRTPSRPGIAAAEERAEAPVMGLVSTGASSTAPMKIEQRTAAERQPERRRSPW